MSRLTRPHRAPSHARTHRQIPTVIHQTHRQAPATCQTSTAASMALTANIWAQQVQTLAYRNSRDRKADPVNENPKISMQWQLI